MKKTLQFVSKSDCSNKSGCYGSRNLLRLKETRELPRHHRVIGNSRTPPEAQDVTVQRPQTTMRAHGTQGVPEPQNSLA